MENYSYRDLDAYHFARQLMVDAYQGSHSTTTSMGSDPLSRTALTVAMNLVDGSSCTDETARREHLRVSLAATDRLETLIADSRDRGQLPVEVAEEMLTLQERAASSLRCSLMALDQPDLA